MNAPVLPPGRPKALHCLTAMRFLAALYVVIDHAVGAWKPAGLVSAIGQLGWLGVAFFFVLSGFVLMWSFDAAVSAKTYMLRRLARIYPLHVVCLALSLSAFFWVGSPLAGYVGTWAGTVENVFLVHDWFYGVPNIRQGWNGVSWTLSCEFFFYATVPVVFPWLSGLAPPRLRLGLIAIWFFLSVMAIISIDRGWPVLLDFYIYSPITRYFEFLLGAAGALAVRQDRGAGHWPAALASSVFPVLVYCVIVPEPRRCDALINLLAIPGIAWFIVDLARRDLNGGVSWLKMKWLRLLGDSSFALYMTHALLLGAVSIARQQRWASRFHGEQQLIVLAYFVGAVGLSICAHRMFEMPVRSWLTRRLGVDSKVSMYAMAGRQDMNF